MAIVVAGSGTQLAVISTEHTLATVTTGGAFVLTVDTVNLANGETVELRLYTKVLSTSTEHLAYYAIYSHAPGSPNKYSVPVPANQSIKATLKQTVGTGRNFDSALLQIDG